jgi:hypothetical protein
MYVVRGDKDAEFVASAAVQRVIESASEGLQSASVSRVDATLEVIRMVQYSPII